MCVFRRVALERNTNTDEESVKLIKETAKLERCSAWRRQRYVHANRNAIDHISKVLASKYKVRESHGNIAQGEQWL